MEAFQWKNYLKNFQAETQTPSINKLTIWEKEVGLLENRQLDLFECYDYYLPERMYFFENGEYPSYVYEVVASSGTTAEQLIETFGKSSQEHLVWYLK